MDRGHGVTCEHTKSILDLSHGVRKYTKFEHLEIYPLLAIVLNRWHHAVSDKYVMCRW